MEPFLGQIMPVGWNFAARGWSLCDGQLLPIAQNTALFSLLGTTFGGDGRTTFALPDLRGRVPIHVGNAPGLSSISWGQKGGENNHTLTTPEIPSHNHSVALVSEGTNATTGSAAGNMLANTSDSSYAAPNTRPNANMSSEAISQQNVGGSQSHNNMQPFLGLYFEIAMTGIFPSRS